MFSFLLYKVLKLKVKKKLLLKMINFTIVYFKFDNNSYKKLFSILKINFEK